MSVLLSVVFPDHTCYLAGAPQTHAEGVQCIRIHRWLLKLQKPATTPDSFLKMYLKDRVIETKRERGRNREREHDGPATGPPLFLPTKQFSHCTVIEGRLCHPAPLVDLLWGPLSTRLAPMPSIASPIQSFQDCGLETLVRAFPGFSTPSGATGIILCSPKSIY